MLGSTGAPQFSWHPESWVLFGNADLAGTMSLGESSSPRRERPKSSMVGATGRRNMGGTGHVARGQSTQLMCTELRFDPKHPINQAWRATRDPSTQKVEAEGPETQDPSWLCGEFKASLGYTRHRPRTEGEGKRTGEIAQRLGALTTLAEGPDSQQPLGWQLIIGHDSSSRRCNAVFSSPQTPGTRVAQRQTGRQNTRTHKTKII